MGSRRPGSSRRQSTRPARHLGMGARPLAVEFPDAREGDRHLRVSWHGRQRQLVLSHWRDGVCVASTPLPIDEIPRLSAFLADALYEASTAAPAGPTDAPPTLSSLREDTLTVVRGWFRPKLAPVIHMADRRNPRP